VHVNLTKYPKWLRLLTNDVATVLSASRFFSSFVQSQLRVPNAHLQQALAYLFASTDAALEEEREKIHLRKAEAECEALRSTLDFGAPLDSLPLITRSEFAREGRAKKWVLCDGYVFDVKDFQRSHPGGEAILEPFFGNDITRAFNGSVYNHSNGARNLSRHFIIARIKQSDAVDEVVLPEVDTTNL
jgi:cytochrome b involved in lipid metabolism